MGNRAICDTKAGVWISDAGEEFGKIPNTKGVVGNLYNEQEEGGFADLMYASGVNSIIDHPQFGVVYWGNRTCYLDQSKQLRFDNVAELYIFIMLKMKEF
jgi:phage tail sheath protein FI